ncbi:hypothetical protein PAESOLCIP111_03795 [Paenibacillus solanacearum]|uniref:DUF7402 domain-containing protein n=1 Tax=Paenibacillus solanacearum TaxID=2048548 RepID=A0A916K6Z5_9BACL|nr:glycoside hydrolase family 43 protein [Paenibacillus solanacearum]CAG7636901.1 hypothetical protein PAESOLCIP111_03795 [Paenibacillus solanacearum]
MMNRKTAIIGFAIVVVAAAAALAAQLSPGTDQGRHLSAYSQPSEAQARQPELPVRSAGDELLFNNPLQENAADPGVFRASDGLYYAYVTGMGFKTYASPDLVHWKSEGPSLPVAEVSSWAKQDFWAPYALEYKGKYYLFFSASAGKGTPKRLSVAVSDSPKGPFKHPEKTPVFRFGPDIDPAGVIDPYVFMDDDGKIYLYFTKALHNVGDHKESHIYAVELNEDLHSYKGKPVRLTQPEQDWENKGKTLINEGSWMLKHNGIYYLMYSANCACNKQYSVGFATSKSPTGPFVKWEHNPILQADYDGVSGTGHHSVVPSPDGSELWMVYHSRMNQQDNEKAGQGNPRQLNIDKMGFREDGSIYVNGPTLTKQAAPSGSTAWRNIAADAKLTVSSVSGKEGSEKLLTDGEIGLYAAFAQNEWAPSNEERSWVKLEWKEAHEVSTVLLHDSGDPKRAIHSGKLLLDDGTSIPIVFPKEPGAAAIAAIGGTKITSLTFVLDKERPDGTYGLSEMTVLGK